MIVEIERFIKVVDENSFTKASEKLFITQPALSLSIQRLEKETGVKLFKRTGKRFILTKDGEFIYTLSLQIIKLWEKIKDPVVRKQKLPFYSVGLYDNAALKLSKYFQKNLTKKDFHFEITIDRSSSLLKGLQAGIYDLSIFIINQEVSILNANLIKVFREKLLPVSSKKWDKKNGRIPFILYNKNSTTRGCIDKVFLENKIKPKIIVESTNPDFMKELAIGGCGVALLPKNFVEREINQKKLFIQKFPFSFERKIGVFLSKEGNLREQDEVVKDILQALN